MDTLNRPIIERTGGFLLERLTAVAGAVGENALNGIGYVFSSVDPARYLVEYDDSLEAAFWLGFGDEQ